MMPRMIADLLRPEAYGHPADDPRLHETHSSWVVLVGPYAYKLKKPVNLGFLDFTTVEGRRADCVEELRVNRRFSPDVYLGIVEVVEQGGRFRVGGASGSGEPAVWMRRLPEEGMLTELLTRGDVSVRLAQRIGRQLARFHAAAATGPGVNDYGSPATIRTNWQENFDQMAPFVDRTVSHDLDEDIRVFVDSFMDEHTALLDNRVRSGRIRDGHGDLHAASICIENGQIRLFDSLQFAARFRCSDVAAEVAFLAMDFEHHARADLAWAFVDAYVRASGDSELLSLIDFYACYRAYVRGKVRSLRLAQSGQTAADESRLVGEAQAYFDLAWAHAVGFSPPPLVVTMGMPASGKTTLARALAGRLGLVHASSDMVRKALAGIRPTEHRAEGFRQGLYEPAMTRRTYSALRREAARWLRRGRGVVMDATFGNPAERALVARLARRLGTPLHIVVCQADERTLQNRLALRATEQGVVSDARLELWDALRGAFIQPDEFPDAVYVHAARDAEQTTQEALAHLRVALNSNTR